MVPSKQEVRSSYESSAWYYDLALRLYGWAGIGRAYRSRAVERMRLAQGDTVLELGCGTGANFALIEQRIGPAGRLIGVDLSARMLQRAEKRVKRSGWTNVELVHEDIGVYSFPDRVNGILSVGVFGYIDDLDPVLQRAQAALQPGGHLVVLDGKRPDRLPKWVFRSILWLSRPFGVTESYFDQPTLAALGRQFPRTRVEEMYGGMLFIATAPASEPDLEAAAGSVRR